MGLFAIAGSAGDCDGKCMEYANTWEEMFMVLTIGFALIGTGGFILFKKNT
jgi:LPXTG-motif cell wall-anchored protein